MKRPSYLLHPLRPFRRKAHRPPPGSSPGLVQHTTPKDVPPPSITVLAYGPDRATETPLEDLDELRRIRGTFPVLWVNVDGVQHIETVRELGTIFGLHRLALEDVVNVPQRPKVENYGERSRELAPPSPTQQEMDRITAENAELKRRLEALS